ncbi:MAG: hypothetical protein JO112_00840 [Planctomycetes bacterium]|nr:hypothetical protein [Planctomycetota bacterium]
MDFIERWLGISPDGGNGVFEILLLASLAAGVGVLAYYKRMLHSARRWLTGRQETGDSA